MSASHEVIYVPGLGDDRPHLHLQALWLWRLQGLRPHFSPVGWGDGEPFSDKLDRLTSKVELLAEMGRVSLVGISAGASAVLNTFAEQTSNVKSVTCICPKIQDNHPLPAHKAEDLLAKNPAFRESFEMLPDSLSKLGAEDRKKIMSMRPLWDEVVHIEDTFIPGAEHVTIPTVGHGPSIAYATTVGSLQIARFIKGSLD